MEEAMFLIEEDVPIPEDKPSFTAQIIGLNVGESFMFPKSNRPSVQSIASKVKAASKKEFVVRIVDADNCRIWRKK